MKKLIAGIVVLLVLLGSVIGIVVKGETLVEYFFYTKDSADLEEYFGVSGKEAVVFFNEQEVASQGIIVDDITYLPLEFVQASIDGRFYWDGSTDAILFTNAEKIYQESIEDKSVALLQEDVLYVSLDFIQEHAELDAEVYQNPNRIFLDTRGRERTYAQVNFDTVVRATGGRKGKILTDILAGEQVEILYEWENWMQVRTEDGFVGYVKKKSLADAQTQSVESTWTEPEYTNISLDEDVCLAWQQVTTMSANNNLDKLIQKAKGLNVISPTWFAMTGNDGSYQNLASETYVEKAHEAGLQVWVLADDFSQDMSIGTVLGNTKIRQKLVKNFVKDTLAVGADGINIDFEYISENSGEDYIQFLRELSVSCRKKGLILSVDNANPTYIREQYHMEEQGKIVDYVIIMAYDEHYNGTCAGSVASISYVKEGINTALSMVPAKKLVNGLPFYIRVWKETPAEYAEENAQLREDGESEYDSYALSYENVSMAQAQELLKEYGVEAEWQDDLKQYYAEIPLKNGKYRIWLEDAKSLTEKMELVKENHLAGVACWKIGLETEDVWEVITNYLN